MRFAFYGAAFRRKVFGMITHQQIDARSLEFHKVIARKLRADPALLEIAKANAARWLASCSERSRGAIVSWQRLLDRGDLSEILAVLEDSGEAGARMRQNSPFCGILSNRERNEIILAFKQ